MLLRRQTHVFYEVVFHALPACNTLYPVFHVTPYVMEYIFVSLACCNAVCHRMALGTSRCGLCSTPYYERRGQVKRLNITVEILVNAAGVCRVGRLESCSEEDLEAQLLLNVMGTTLLTRRFVKGKPNGCLLYY